MGNGDSRRPTVGTAAPRPWKEGRRHDLGCGRRRSIQFHRGELSANCPFRPMPHSSAVLDNTRLLPSTILAEPPAASGSVGSGVEAEAWLLASRVIGPPCCTFPRLEHQNRKLGRGRVKTPGSRRQTGYNVKISPWHKHRHSRTPALKRQTSDALSASDSLSMPARNWLKAIVSKLVRRLGEQ